MADKRYDLMLVHLGGELNLLEKGRLAGWDLWSVSQAELREGYGVREGWNMYTDEIERFCSPEDAARLMWSNFSGFTYREEVLTVAASSRSVSVSAALTILEQRHGERLLAVLPVVSYEMQKHGDYRVLIEVALKCDSVESHEP